MLYDPRSCSSLARARGVGRLGTSSGLVTARNSPLASLNRWSYELKFHPLNILGELGNYRGDSWRDNIDLDVAFDLVGVDIQTLATDLIPDSVRIRPEPICIAQRLK